MKKLYHLPAWKLIQLYKKKKITPKEVLAEIFKRIKKVEGKISAFVFINQKKFKSSLKFDPDQPLSGIPIAIKDNICQKGVEITCGSKILKNFISPYDATVIERLKKAGAILIGNTNMDEFAFGSSTENSSYGPTKNPWDLERVPGGSSGGSAAAVASGEAILALGSDTGGSIRQPASFCGVCGFKPTYGRISRYGLIAFASSLDQIGPLARDVKDIALISEAISGKDEKDSTSLPLGPIRKEKCLKKGISGIKIGVLKESFKEGIDLEVKNGLIEAIKIFEKLGAKVKRISLPLLEYCISCYYILAPAEASSNLARFDGVQYGWRDESKELEKMYLKTRGFGFGKEVKRRIILGTYVLSAGYFEAYYLKALKVRNLIKKAFDRIFKNVDVLILPTSPTVAFKIGEKIDDPLKMYLSDIFTVPANLAGLPAISIPCGFSQENLPLGLQILGNALADELILKVAYNFQLKTSFHLKNPKL